MRYGPVYHDAVAIQRALMVDAINPAITPAARAQVARAWRDVEDLKRCIRMKPNPKPIDVSGLANGKQQKQPRSSFTESAGPVVASVPVVPKPETPQA